MSSRFDPPKYNRGDPIRAADINAQNDEIKRLGGLRLGAGLMGRQGPHGPIISANPEDGCYPAVLSGDMASGTFASPASANAALYIFDGTAYVDAGLTIKVYSGYTLSSSISSGKVIWVARHNGFWHLLTANC